MSEGLLVSFGQTPPTTFERERRGFAGVFEVYADRKAKAFIMLSSGISDKGGRTQHLMSADDAEALGRALLNAADFARVPLILEKVQL